MKSTLRWGHGVGGKSWSMVSRCKVGQGYWWQCHNKGGWKGEVSCRVTDEVKSALWPQKWHRDMRMLGRVLGIEDRRLLVGISRMV